MRCKAIACIFMALSGGSLGAASEGTMPAAPFLWWSVGTAGRLPDGRAEQALALAASFGPDSVSAGIGYIAKDKAGVYVDGYIKEVFIADKNP